MNFVCCRWSRDRRCVLALGDSYLLTKVVDGFRVAHAFAVSGGAV